MTPHRPAGLASFHRALASASRCLPAVLAALALASCSTSAPPPVAAPSPAPPAPTPIATVAPAVEIPQPATAPAPERDDTRPPLIRVLLAGGPDVELPDPGRRYLCAADGVLSVVRGPLQASGGSSGVAFQVGAFAAADNARTEADRLGAAGLAARVEEGADGLSRVFVAGRAGEDESALLGRLAAAGISSTGRRLAMGGEVHLTGEGGTSLTGAAIRIVPLDAEPVRVGADRYRGEFEVRPASTGVRLINVLNLETYLRGVVPAEMGPRAFPAIEALKAQAVAARTYAVSHLGDHAADGYDICATQACQVYQGATIEHPLTDRAVEETAGEIAVYDGKPIDAMYHSTCGGRTEDAAALLPERAAPYLVGVACRGEQQIRLGSREPAGPWVGREGMLVQVGGRFAALLGVPARAAPLAAALTGRSVGPGPAALLRAYSLERAPALLHETSGAGVDDDVVTLLDTFRLPTPPPQNGRRREWELAVAVRLAELAGEAEELSGRLVVASGGGARVFDPKSGESMELTGAELVLERRGEAWRRAEVSAMVGSRATLWCVRGRCPVLEIEPRREADDGSAWGWWVRDVPLATIAERFGLTGVSGLRVPSRGRSGRALSIELDSAAGRSRVAGMRFRLVLGLPDTLFVVSVRPTDHGPIAHFVGRGWGHGIGMCQNGAYGLALGGATYKEILRTYYTGIAVVRSDPSAGGQ